MRIAGYARVSTDRQAEQGISLEDQIMQINRWADNNGHSIVDIFEEPGASAFEDRRQIFQLLIDRALSSDHPYDAIVIHSLSRFYRDNILRELVTRKLKKADVTVISLTQPMPADDNMAHLVENVMGIIDEFNSRENAKHVIRCQRRNAELGFFNGSRPPFGYKTFATDIPARNGFKKKLTIHPEEAEIVRLMFRLADEGDGGVVLGTKKIAAILNRQGTLNRGKLWRHTVVHLILRNTAYIGEFKSFRREARTGKVRPMSEWITTEIPPIVDRSLFSQVQDALATRQLHNVQAKSAQVPTLLTGLLRCGKCGKGMTLMSGKSGRYRYYRCATKGYYDTLSCDCPNLPKEELERAVLESVANAILQPERIRKLLDELRVTLAKAREPDIKRLRALQRDAALQTERITVLYDQAGSGAIELEDSLRDYLRTQQRKLATINREIEILQGRQQLPLRKFGQDQIENFTDAVRKELLDPNSGLAKPYLKAIVQEIRIQKKDAVITGNTAQLAAAVSKWKPGTPVLEVPGFVSEWRARRDSNS